MDDIHIILCLRDMIDITVLLKRFPFLPHPFIKIKKKFSLKNSKGDLIQFRQPLDGEAEVARNRVGGEKGSLQGTGVDGREGTTSELFSQCLALGIAFWAQVRIASALYPSLHIPGRLPMPRDVNINQWCSSASGPLISKYI